MNQFIETLSQYPKCQSSQLIFDDHQIICKNCSSEFAIINNKPVFIREDNEIFSPSFYTNAVTNYSSKEKKNIFSKIVPSPSIAFNHAERIQNFAQTLKKFTPAYVLVVGGGNQKRDLDRLMSEYSNIKLIYSDVDVNADVDLFCDAHDLPFQDQVFHGIITTAVLEHVLYPEKVVSEMHRVLKDGGVIYSEIPFMQQVHEGAYDFTRYTLSGHRRLFNYFSEISSGLVAGPGTVLVWSIEHFALCFTGNNTSRLLTKALVRLMFSWLKYFDYLFKNNPQALDGASCTYFLGEKSPEKVVSDQMIIERYKGANNLRHT
jgi:ubiquinone/menaquinone biosynthesis C-methylase UbiE